jgi:hypothetical protein
MLVSNLIFHLLCTMVFLGFTPIRASGGSVLPTRWHRSKVGESNHPSVKLASSTHNVTSVAPHVSPGGATTSTSIGTRSKSGSRLSHDSKARFAGVGENGLCYLADGIEEGLKAKAGALERGMKSHGESLGGSFEQGMKYVAVSIAFSSAAICSAAICIAFRK